LKVNIRRPLNIVDGGLNLFQGELVIQDLVVNHFLVLHPL